MIKATRLRICGISMLAGTVLAQTPPDTTARDMRAVVVTSQVATTTVGLQADGTMRWDTGAFSILPRILGNADPVHYAQMLPGVQTGSELDAGLHIQGSDNTHNTAAIHGVPIYNAAHLLGVFSVFNASHYADMTLKKHANSGADPTRLGGTLSMQLADEPPDSLHGQADVGLISSQGTLRLPTGRNSGLTLSARASYLNLLYSKWLAVEDMMMHYGFADMNATWQWRPHPHHQLWADAYCGYDRVNMSQDEYQADMKLAWRNNAEALHWQYMNPDGPIVRSRLYHTGYANRLRISQDNMQFRLPSGIDDVGWNASVGWHSCKLGAEAVWHSVLTQAPEAQDVFGQTFEPVPRQHTAEYALYADYSHGLLLGLTADVGVRVTAYCDDVKAWHAGIDPSARITYRRANWQLSAEYALRHQYLFQTGTTALGMPTEFWASTGSLCAPQWGHHVGLSSSVYLADGMWRISADAYWKQIYNQVEYYGDMMKFLNSDYHLADNLLYGYGHNYGFSVTVAKRKGELTGWIAYAFGRARRRFDAYEGQAFSASHERPHELNALVAWHIGRRWDVSATYVFASGTPFTAPESFYVMNGMLLTQYGPHNAQRLRPYNRLDLSANYKLPVRLDCGLNLSIYNATMQQNDISCRLKVSNGHYLYSHFGLITFMLPSISYYMKF